MKNTLNVNGLEIRYRTVNEADYISLTDLAKYKTDAPDRVISTWMRIYNTICYLGTWEILHNPDFKPHTYEGFKIESAENAFWLSPQKWVEGTNAIGMFSKAGRHGGGTFAHKDIAFKFASWLSVEFELYVIKEFQRLKAEEYKQLGWEAKRELARINYKIQTDAIKQNLIPVELTRSECTIVYASEADVLNKVLFHMTAKEWRDANPDKKGNLRDYASVEQLLVLANMESLNAEFIKMGMTQADRMMKLNAAAISQMTSLLETREITARGTQIADNLLLASGKKRDDD